MSLSWFSGLLKLKWCVTFFSRLVPTEVWHGSQPLREAAENLCVGRCILHDPRQLSTQPASDLCLCSAHQALIDSHRHWEISGECKKIEWLLSRIPVRVMCLNVCHFVNSLPAMSYILENFIMHILWMVFCVVCWVPTYCMSVLCRFLEGKVQLAL